MVSVIALALILISAAVVPADALAIPDNRQTYKYETITDVLGITRADIVEWLSMHEDDDYYLGTPYCYRAGRVLNGREVPVSFDIHGSLWGLWPLGYNTMPYVYCPNGDVIEGCVPQLNCGGFVHHVLTHASNKDGTENRAVTEMIKRLEDIYDGSGMGFTGASSFFMAMQCSGVRFYTFDTIEDMLASGIMEKGDIMIIDGIGPYGMVPDRFNNPRDWHIGFFWGDSPDDDSFWHSIHEALGEKSITLPDGTVLTNPAIIQNPDYPDQIIKGPLTDPYSKTEPALCGNVITRIAPASEYEGMIVLKFGDLPTGWQENKDGSRKYITESGSTANGWQIIDGSYYYFEDTVMCTGQKEIDGESYDFGEDGACLNREVPPQRPLLWREWLIERLREFIIKAINEGRG